MLTLVSALLTRLGLGVWDMGYHPNLPLSRSLSWPGCNGSLGSVRYVPASLGQVAAYYRLNHNGMYVPRATTTTPPETSRMWDSV
ncbi:hypothetical protein F4819DRAFT_443117 [Hypoxylon fuscum]|nr:hypothetical protein F4819DRAFT_443117 [Hypoxylon fuscum]